MMHGDGAKAGDKDTISSFNQKKGPRHNEVGYVLAPFIAKTHDSGCLGSESLAALSTTTSQYAAAVFSAHALHEAVHAFAVTLLRLKSTLCGHRGHLLQLNFLCSFHSYKT